ncbi:restriction endonuclease subunit S [Bacteroides ovatus]|uniref:restriction endonuclease subunit S n=1 Tax=Bacteroides ovatus TaxID=28116 RepID=UPI00189AF659|nr:restriction endonuclease subunit S [Bacteroides ovatus]MDC2357017.1 restriction endonuclease subunit S [Bacteroides ovatus]MDC2398485.1 restriction endonuclease subunit S [Bacteroides ovatus]MDC2470044.1 restriction endonuclease subunit S [Bacteroides ovatus]MDC2490181.1 restriction endonuclease subunit S [Bacteroides ovatus]MDC2494563.1 restriction endonuclease subunit S [Bacteroides ovatus]
MDTKKLRQKILDLAIRGKLVPQDPNDEPASVLLERIKEEKERLIKEGKIKKSKKTVSSDTPHYPYLLPNGWEWCRLNEIAESSLGKTLDKSRNTGKVYPYLCAINVKWNDFDLSVVKTIKLEDNEKERYQVLKGDLLICEGGDVGRSAIWDSNEPIYYQNALHRVRFFDNIVADFYLYLIWCYKNYNWIDDICNGVTIKHFTQDKINALYFPLPPVAEQQRIVAEIKRWFALIDQIEQGKSNLQTTIRQAKSKILDLAIHGKLVPQDPNDEPAIELLKRINPNFTPCDNGHYQNLPAGWAMCKLSDLCRIENGFAFSSNDYKPQGIPLVRISNIIHNTIDITDCVYIEGITDNKFKISKGDLLIAMSGATTGKMGVYPFDETAYLNQRVGNIKILNKSSLSPVYRNTYMQSKVDEILKIAYGGAQPNISASVIGNFDFPLPPYKEQIRIIETVQRIFDQLDVITESL